jgi:hypothetical protein
MGVDPKDRKSSDRRDSDRRDSERRDADRREKSDVRRQNIWASWLGKLTEDLAHHC